MARMVKRTLTPEEKRLWMQITRDIAPLDSPEEGPVEEAPPSVNSHPPAHPHLPSIPRSPAQRLPLAQGAYAGIDHHTAERFRKGKYPLDATLDLHGMTRDVAFAALARFLRAHQQRRSRCLLVITGKGARKGEHDAAPVGILRALMPQWLAAEEIRPMILAFDAAAPRHGGSGAYYILLRRKRDVR